MTEITLQEALSEVGKWGRIVKGFEKVSEAAAVLAGAEQLTAERQKAADALVPLIEERQAQLEAATAAIDAAKAQAEVITATATEKADAMLAEARAAVKAESELAAGDLSLKRADLAEATDALASIQAQTLAAQATLDDLLSRITAANEARRKIIAGEA